MTRLAPVFIAVCVGYLAGQKIARRRHIRQLTKLLDDMVRQPVPPPSRDWQDQLLKDLEKASPRALLRGPHEPALRERND